MVTRFTIVLFLLLNVCDFSFFQVNCIPGHLRKDIRRFFVLMKELILFENQTTITMKFYEMSILRKAKSSTITETICLLKKQMKTVVYENEGCMSCSTTSGHKNPRTKLFLRTLKLKLPVLCEEDTVNIETNTIHWINLYVQHRFTINVSCIAVNTYFLKKPLTTDY